MAIGSKLRGVALVGAIAALAACGSDMVTAPGGGSYHLGPPIPTGNPYYQPQAGAVKVCSFDLPGVFATTENPSSPTTLQEASESINAGFCSVTWLRNGAAGSFDVTVQQTGPGAFDLRRIAVVHTNPLFNQNNEDPQGCSGTKPIPTTITVPLPEAGSGAAIWFKECPAAPPPPGECSGLTPGFWKNYDNHYTEAQFAALIDGTSLPGLTNAQAVTILKGNNPALVRLKKFMLANELTISLSNHPGFPNPSGGSLSGDCSAGSMELGDALTLAHTILNANGVGYTNQQILDAGTVLDDIANLGGG